MAPRGTFGSRTEQELRAGLGAKSFQISPGRSLDAFALNPGGWLALIDRTLDMACEPLTDEAVFRVARKISATDARAEYLRQACADNFDLRERVEELLRAHDEVQSFLESPAAAPFIPTITERPVTEALGTVIGPYKLREQIGAGGMGIVYVADQERPVRRRVALKLIKPGMDTRDVIARFEAERQALALMDHPHIAKVLDAGASDTGR